jgi:CheY-like chemotaxis protein
MSKKILLADDSITIQKVVELTFSDGDYEVVAVNNGAKAIQKLSEMRPDIILSDIIMPEKNGYEVCEFVKSHPDYRSIPVVLLTGTFEPFDPDRADKAGCDAVVTKPFESQSLIHKVEELIAQSRPAGAAAESAPPAAAPSLWSQEPSPAPQFETENDDVFGAPAAPAAETPFDTPPAEAFSGETRAFPRMSFEELQQMQQPATPAPPPPPAEPSPWDDQSPAVGGETRAFPRMSFDDLQQGAPASAPPLGEPEPPAEASPWDEPAAPAASSAPWEEAPVGGETRAFPRMSFEDLQQMGSPSAPAAEPEPEEAPRTSAPSWEEPPAWSPASESPVERESFPPLATSPFSESTESESPFAAEPEPEPEPERAPAYEPAPTFESAPAYQPPPAYEPPPPAASPATSAMSGNVELTEEQIDRIARRVVQLLSNDVVKNIAWEVIPDMAEMVVKERIRQLESEA